MRHRSIGRDQENSGTCGHLGRGVARQVRSVDSGTGKGGPSMASILIIDDEEQMRTALRRLLEGAGYEVISASDGKEGLALYRENTTDLIITDLIMPEKEGIETIIELKQISPDVKIIAISGGGHNNPEDYLPLAKQLGAQRTIAKPFGGEEFLEAVRELIG
jgi:CheY-like chemotaxis protein